MSENECKVEEVYLDSEKYNKEYPTDKEVYIKLKRDVLVTNISGPSNIKMGDKVEYIITGYSINKTNYNANDINEKDKNKVKWRIEVFNNINEKQPLEIIELLKTNSDYTIEKDKLIINKINEKWCNLNIRIYPYIKQATYRVMSSTNVKVGCFLGKVIEVTSFDNELKTILNKSKVTQPHWKSKGNFKDSTGGSISPAIIPARQGTKVITNIKIEVTKAQGISGNGKIKGILSDGTKISLEGEFPITVGIHSIKVELLSKETTLARHCGDIKWEIDIPNYGKQSMGSSFIEVYRIIEDTSHPFLNNGRPIEALRFLYDKLSLSRVNVKVTQTSDINITAKITRYLHKSHGLKYDTYSGASHFLMIKGRYDASFKLYDYINKSIGNIVNCYDQASAVNVFSAIMGTSGEKIFVKPFGYIKETNLIGEGSCNNPFYNSNGSKKVIDLNSSNRTAFGNHQFYKDKSKMIFDACAGPHLGTETYNEYLKNSVDISRGKPSWVSYTDLLKINEIV